MKPAALTEKIIQEEDVYSLCHVLLNEEPTAGQQRIIRSIVFQKHPRITIRAFTRYGKTRSLATATALYLLLNEDKIINFISPKFSQTKKYRSYLLDCILSCPALIDLLETKKNTVIKREVSKKKISFKNGCEVNFLTAGGSDMAQGLMGEGGDVIIEDEAASVSDEVYRKRIHRQLLDSRDTMLIESSNPWPGNHFQAHAESPEYLDIKIGWKQGVREGRITLQQVQEQKKELTDAEFTVLLEAEFPDSVEDALIPYSWIREAAERSPQCFKTPEEDFQHVAGLDVSRMGSDKTVLTLGRKRGNRYIVDDIHVWEHKNTMQSVGRTISHLNKDKERKLMVDVIGVGSGVCDRLREQGYNALPVNVGTKPLRGKQEYRNKKAEFYWRLRSLFEEALITIPEDKRLMRELSLIRYDFTSSGKKKIVDPSKSPDFADSLMLMVSPVQDRKLVFGSAPAF